MAKATLATKDRPGYLPWMQTGYLPEYPQLVAVFVGYLVVLALLSPFLFAVPSWARLGTAWAAPTGGSASESWKVLRFAFYTSEGISVVSAGLNLGIVLLGTGVILSGCSRKAALLAVENAYAEEANDLLLEEQRRLRAGGRNASATLTLDQFLDRLPSNVHKYLRTPRVFERIVGAARDFQFESCATLLEPYERWQQDELSDLRRFARLAIHLGIFGTFVGLVLAITPIRDLSGGVDMKRMGELFQTMFTSLNTCFTSSIAGLVTAFAVHAGVGLVHRRSNHYLGNLETAVLTAISVARRCYNDSVLTAEFGLIRQELRGQNQALEAQRLIIVEKLNKLGELAPVFDNVQKSFTGFGTSVTKGLGDLRQEVSPEKWAGDFRDSVVRGLNGGLTQLGDQFSKAASAIGSAAAALNSSTEALAGEIARNKALADRADAAMKLLEATFKRHAEQQASAAGEIGGLLGSAFDRYLDGKTTAKVVEALTTLNKGLGEAKTTTDSLRRDLQAYRSYSLDSIFRRASAATGRALAAIWSRFFNTTGRDSRSTR